MCLYTDQLSPKITNKDITVFKYIHIDDGMFVSPHKGYQYKSLGKVNETVLQTEPEEIWHESGCVDYGFHSFKYLDDAIEISNTIGSYSVIECIIPKGSLYYEGIGGGNKVNYCSNKIILNRQINKSEVFIRKVKNILHLIKESFTL